MRLLADLGGTRPLLELVVAYVGQPARVDPIDRNARTLPR